MAKGKVIILGIAIIVAFYATFLVLPRFFGIELEFLSYPLVYFAIILAGTFLVISGFLPYDWGKIFRYIAYFCLFILILFLEMNVMKAALKRYPTQEITLKGCTTLFGKKDKPESVIDVVGIWSCVTTGYFPSKEGELGWSVFAIFYIILPFAFIWTFLYGMMSGIGFQNLFGNSKSNFGSQAIILLSFIISMYATRQLFGFFLLDMFGYGAWGLAGVFGAAFFTLGLRQIIEKWYGIEEWAKEIEDSVKVVLEKEKNAKYALVTYLKNIRKFPGDNDVLNALNLIHTPGSTAYLAFSALSSETQTLVMTKINQAGTANVRQIVDELIHFLS